MNESQTMTRQEYAKLRLALKYAYRHLSRCQDTNTSVSEYGAVAMTRIQRAWPLVSASPRIA